MADQARNKILLSIKSAGPQTAAELAEQFAVTPVAIRQHLDQLSQDGLIEFEDTPQGRGRPRRTWSLTDAGHGRFPDSHSELVLGMIQSVRTIFGEEGLDRLIEERRMQSVGLYRDRLSKAASPFDRVKVLAAARSEEGYMAHAEQTGDQSFLLIENHCSICAAAQACQGFCRAEQAAFEDVLGPEYSVERTEHRLAGARRCVYEIKQKTV